MRQDDPGNRSDEPAKPWCEFIGDGFAAAATAYGVLMSVTRSMSGWTFAASVLVGLAFALWLAIGRARAARDHREDPVKDPAAPEQEEGERQVADEHEGHERRPGEEGQPRV